MKKNRKIKKAVALRYDQFSGSAPVLKAKGSGITADNIIETAKKYNIPIKEDSDLTEILSKLELEEEIPSSLYTAIAELLAYIYSRNKEK